MGVVVVWSTGYNGTVGSVDTRVADMPVLADGVHDVMASHVNTLGDAVIYLQSRQAALISTVASHTSSLATLSPLTVRELDGTPAVPNVNTLEVSNGTLTDMGGGVVRFTGAGASDHGALTGLADDDHTQYLLIDGSRAMDNIIELGASPGGGTDGGIIRIWKSDFADAIGIANAGTIFAADVTGVTQLWYRDSAGTEHQLTPPSAGVTDHASLTGLGADDHAQYLLIDGSRAMTGALLLEDMLTPGYPSLAWNTDTTTGLFPPTIYGSIGFMLGGTHLWTLDFIGLYPKNNGENIGDSIATPLGASPSYPISTVFSTYYKVCIDGTAALPSIAWDADTDMGVYRVAADIGGLSASGIEVMRWQAVAGVDPQVLVPAGTAAKPTLSVRALNNGVWSSATDTVDIAAGGLNVASFYAPSGANPQLILQSGTIALPSLSIGEPTTGLYLAAANTLRIVANGMPAIQATHTGVTLYYNNIAYPTFGSASMYISGGSYTIATQAVGSGLTIGGRRDSAANTVAGTDASVRFAQYANLPFIGASTSQKMVRIESVINQTGTSSFSALQLDVTNTALGSGAHYFLDLKVGGTTVAGITNGSTAALQGNFLAGGGAHATPGISFFGDPDTGLANVAANRLTVVTGGSERWRFEGANLIAITSTALLSMGVSGGGMTLQGAITTGNVAANTMDNGSSFTASSGAQKMLRVRGTINQTSTAGFAGIEVDLINTVLGSGAQYFADFKISGTTVAAITNGSTTALQGRFLAGPGALATPSWSFLADPNTGVWNSAGDTLDLVTNGSSKLTVSTTSITPKLDMIPSTSFLSLGSSGTHWNSAYLNDTYVSSGGGIFQWPYATVNYHTNNTAVSSDPVWIDNGGDAYAAASHTVNYIAGRNTTIGNARLRVTSNTASGDCQLELVVNGSGTGHKITFGAAATGSFTTGDAPVAINDGDRYGWQLTSAGTGSVSLTLTHDLTATNP